MFKPKAKYKPGDLVVWNKFGNFGNEEDRLFHIHSVRYGIYIIVMVFQRNNFGILVIY